MPRNGNNSNFFSDVCKEDNNAMNTFNELFLVEVLFSNYY